MTDTEVPTDAFRYDTHYRQNGSKKIDNNWFNTTLTPGYYFVVKYKILVKNNMNSERLSIVKKQSNEYDSTTFASHINGGYHKPILPNL